MSFNDDTGRTDFDVAYNVARSMANEAYSAKDDWKAFVMREAMSILLSWRGRNGKQ